MMTQEEKNSSLEAVWPMDRKARALTHEERMHICDMGFYNDVIRGYLIEAMKFAEFNREDITKALDGLKWSFDRTTAAEAEDIYKKF